jgi:hypothetical protein
MVKSRVGPRPVGYRAPSCRPCVTDLCGPRRAEVAHNSGGDVVGVLVHDPVVVGGVADEFALRQELVDSPPDSDGADLVVARPDEQDRHLDLAKSIVETGLPIGHPR